jgi:hypothetical protein
MSVSQKIPTMVATPLTPSQNMMYFHVSGDERPIDMKSSYIELEMGYDQTPADKRNIVLGADGLYYPSSALVRQSRLTKSQTGEIIQDLQWTNVLDCNLRHYHTGSNEVVADAIFSGAGHVNPATKEIESVFYNNYSDANPTLRVPLENLFPGSIGQTHNLPLGSGDCEFRFLLEPQYNVLMRAVASGVYDQGTASSGTEYAFENINGSTGATTLNASALDTIANFTAGNTVLISGVNSGVRKVWIRTVGVVTADSPPTKGNFTFTGALSGTNNITSISVFKLTNSKVLGCAPLTATNNTDNLITQQVCKDLFTNTKVKVHYTEVSPNTVDIKTPVFVEKSVSTSVSNIIYQSGTTIASLVFKDNVVLASSQVAINIWVEPLYTNMTEQWQVLSAHLVLYRRNMKLKSEKMLVQNFESVNVQCVSGLNRFMYNYKVRAPTYNVWAIQPSQTNLYSQAQNVSTYLFTLDERPLTSIYVDTASAVHNDNVGRVCANSPIYKLKNLRGNRDREINSEIEPIVFPAKLYNAMIAGESNVLEGNDRNLRIELVPAVGSSTASTNVYLFMEKHQEL